jgi:hypothetical protein
MAAGSGFATQANSAGFAPLRPFDWAQGVPSIVEGRGARRPEGNMKNSTRPQTLPAFEPSPAA